MSAKMDVGLFFSPSNALGDLRSKLAHGVVPLRTHQCLRLRFGDIKHRRNQEFPILLDDIELLYNLKVDPNVWFACEKRNP